MTIPHIAQASGNEEWYTPSEIIEAARLTMNGIDVDPASSDFAQQWIQARKHFTKETDGLTQPWPGRVWLNPPYTKGMIDKFVCKLIEKLRQYETRQAIVLVNNATQTKWGQCLIRQSNVVCFPARKVRFVNQAGQCQGSPLQGQMICGLRVDEAKFRYYFQDFGAVLCGVTPCAT